jgi:hypothetical protein
MTWSLSVAAQGDWRTKTLLSDTDSNSEQHLHLFDSNPTYDSATNTTTFIDSAQGHSRMAGTSPEVWHMNLYFGINVSIQNFLNGQAQFLPLSTPNYVGSYSATIIQCTSPTGTCYAGTIVVRNPFELPKGYFFPWIYNATLSVQRSADAEQTLFLMNAVFPKLLYGVLGALALFIAVQLTAFWTRNSRIQERRLLAQRILRRGYLNDVYFEVLVGVLFFIPVFILTLSSILAPIALTPALQYDNLYFLLGAYAVLLIASLVAYLATRLSLDVQDSAMPDPTGEGRTF